MSKIHNFYAHNSDGEWVFKLKDEKWQILGWEECRREKSRIFCGFIQMSLPSSILKTMQFSCRCLCFKVVANLKLRHYVVGTFNELLNIMLLSICSLTFILENRDNLFFQYSELLLLLIFFFFGFSRQHSSVYLHAALELAL